MSQIINVQDGMPAAPIPAEIEFFDPPMCCPTGLCGPTLDQALLDVSEMIQTLQQENRRVERYQMATHPYIFMNTPEVMRLIREKEMAALPITVVRGKVLKTGAYPTLSEIQTALDGGSTA